MKTVFTYLLLTLLSAFLVLPVHADEEDTENLAKRIPLIMKRIDLGRFSEDDIAKWNKLSLNITSKSDICISEQNEQLKKLEESLKGLGEKVEGESGDVTTKRDSYNKEKDSVNKKLAACTTYKLSAKELNDRLSELSKDFFTRKYLARDLSLYALVKNYLDNPSTLIVNPDTFLWENAGLDYLTKNEWAIVILTTLAGLIAGLVAKIRLRRWVNKTGWQDDYSQNFLLAVVSTLSMYLPRLASTGTAALFIYIYTRVYDTLPFITEFAIALFSFVVVITAIRLVVSPVPPADLFLPLAPSIAKPLAKRLRILVMLGFIGVLAFYTVFSEIIDENNLMLVRNIFSFVFVLNFAWVLWLLAVSEYLNKYRWLFGSVMIIVSLTLVAEWVGYRNLAFEVRISTFITFLVLCGMFIASSSSSSLFNSMDEGRYAWARKLHEYVGVETGKTIPGTTWLRLTTILIIWMLTLFLILKIWDPSDNIIEQLKTYVINGFNIGGYRFVPVQILWALLIFALLLIVSGWLRSQMENKWLTMTSMGRGAREATVTITGYVLFAIAILIALSVAGFDFSNIAIIAGALSVGIGFGLQNIVNNFVSGLILLFERPVRRGDWIQVGTTEGYVRDIRIRSTRIQTFDNSDVIVPNSELISGQVTNLMLTSQRGRAIVAVGVAYGSDTEKVRYILNRIANEHENVVTDGSSPKPLILFRSFGDSSLDFEVRVHMFDVDRRLSTISDLNFEIDKAFREEGIEIPFPQRDLHVKTLPAKLDEKDKPELP